MKKYILVLNNSFQEYFAYRLNFVLWRFRVLVFLLINYYLWTTVYIGNNKIFGYDKSQMMTYILLITVINGIVLSTQVYRVGEDIKYGKLNHHLLRPINYFGFIFARDITDKTINTLFSFVEVFILVYILHIPLFIQMNILNLVPFILALFLAAINYFNINLLLSLVGFWSHDTWAPRFIFSIVVTFLAGLYFPLDILPQYIYSILRILPFTYLVFFPLKIYLGQVSDIFIFQGFTISIFWLVFLFYVVQYIWKRGLKVYTADGG